MPDRVVSCRVADGESRHREAPRSFFIPARVEREGLQPGDHAKLLFEVVDPGPGDPSAERMWVQVLGVDSGRYVGALTNTPRAITTIAVGDRVDFGPEHVIGIPGDWPLLAKKAYVSRRCHDQDIRPGYLYRDDPLNEEDSGWCVMVGDETDDEINNPDNVLLQALGFLLDRWPELKAVLETDGRTREWLWDTDSATYLAAPLT